MTCETCQHFYEKTSECRRYPPKQREHNDKIGFYFYQIYQRFPIVKPECWCGEYKERPTIYTEGEQE